MPAEDSQRVHYFIFYLTSQKSQVNIVLYDNLRLKILDINLKTIPKAAQILTLCFLYFS